MKIAALISGGKDSIYAAFKAAKEHELVCLIAIESENPESYMFHIPNIHLTKLIAEAMNLPLIYYKTAGEKELELKDLKQAIIEAKEQYTIGGLTTGALASKYQKQRIDNICNDLGIESMAPLWHVEPEQYMNELIDEGFEVIITGVASQGLTKDWLMKKIDKQAIEDLKKIKEKIDFHLAFEGGEAETLVLNCPLYKKKIEIMNYEIKWSGSYGEAIIGEARLSNK
jgi:predicted ATP pyrophosphatase (TIGR00289 family)